MKIIILGGGISSLSALWFARKKYPDAEITLFEKSDRLGGWMQTSRDEGYLFERGPRTFSARRSSHLLELIGATGLWDQIIYSNPCSQRRFLYSGKRLRTMGSFLPMLIWPLIREPFIPKGKGEDESIYDFAARRLGHKVTNTLIDAMAMGVYAGDIHQLSVRSCFPFLYQWEQKYGSLVLGALLSKKNKGKKGLFTLQNGMDSLLLEIGRQTKPAIHFKTAVEEIRSDGVVANRTFYPADLLISGLSGAEIGRLTGLWRDFEETDLWLVHLAFKGDVLPKKGFGYLVPTEEGENLLGMVWDSAIFPQQSKSGETRVTAMMRQGSVEAALDAMKRHLGVSALPIYSSVHFAQGAIPQFPVGYGKRLARFEEEVKKKYPSLILLGNYIQGASVDACIGLAKKRLIT